MMSRAAQRHNPWPSLRPLQSFAFFERDFFGLRPIYSTALALEVDKETRPATSFCCVAARDHKVLYDEVPRKRVPDGHLLAQMAAPRQAGCAPLGSRALTIINSPMFSGVSNFNGPAHGI